MKHAVLSSMPCQVGRVQRRWFTLCSVSRILFVDGVGAYDHVSRTAVKPSRILCMLVGCCHMCACGTARLLTTRGKTAMSSLAVLHRPKAGNKLTALQPELRPDKQALQFFDDLLSVAKQAQTDGSSATRTSSANQLVPPNAAGASSPTQDTCVERRKCRATSLAEVAPEEGGWRGSAHLHEADQAWRCALQTATLLARYLDPSRRASIAAPSLSSEFACASSVPVSKLAHFPRPAEAHVPAAFSFSWAVSLNP